MATRLSSNNLPSDHITQTGGPTLQQDPKRCVEAFLHTRVFTTDLWEGEIDQVKAWRFEQPR